MEEEKVFLHALASLPGIGSATLRKMLTHFGSAQDAWAAPAIPESLGLTTKIRRSLEGRHNFTPDPQSHYEKLAAEGITLLTQGDALYPPLLKEIPDAPLVLYVRGNYDWYSTAPCVAVVGSRKITHYGKQVTESLVRELTAAGITIVSGLAFGIDKTAHEAALRAGGQTIAVLGSGIDDAGITPTTHQKLGQEITKQGALISEFPPGSIPTAGNFPLRNRIIAGLSLGTLVIEAAEKSGSLITARLALDYNREVFAVPGSIFSPLSAGTHALLKDGAIPVTNSHDILNALFIVHSQEQKITDPILSLEPDEQKLCSLLKNENLHIDELVQKSHLPAALVASLLLMLEIKKQVHHLGNHIYSIHL